MCIPPQAIQEFVESVNCAKRTNPENESEEGVSGQRRKVTAAIAIKFLLARKFDVPRAVVLYEQHEEARWRDGLYDFDPRSEKLKRELETGKFTILVSRVANGGYVWPHTNEDIQPIHCCTPSSRNVMSRVPQ